MNYNFVLLKKYNLLEEFNFKEFLKITNTSYEALPDLSYYEDIFNFVHNNPRSSGKIKGIIAKINYLGWLILDDSSLSFDFGLYGLKSELLKYFDYCCFFSEGDAAGTADCEIYEKGNLIHEYTSELDSIAFNEAMAKHEKGIEVDFGSIPFRKAKAENKSRAEEICSDFNFNPARLYEDYLEECGFEVF